MSRNGIKAGILEISESLSEKGKRGSDYRPPSEYELSVMKRLSDRLEVRPFISVVVPAYNTDEEHFKEMVMSVLAQTYDELELVIADASDDGSILKAVCDSFEDARIK